MKLTTFARGVVYLVAIAALAVLAILLPELAREEAAGKVNPPITWPFFVIAYILATPFFIALYQTFKFLQLIDKNKAFSLASIKVLQNIKICTIIFSVLVVVITIAGVSYLRTMHPTEDAPPFFMLGFVLAFTSGVIGVFVTLVKKLLSEAIAMKSENDLIV